MRIRKAVVGEEVGGVDRQIVVDFMSGCIVGEGSKGGTARRSG